MSRSTRILSMLQPIPLNMPSGSTIVDNGIQEESSNKIIKLPAQPLNESVNNHLCEKGIHDILPSGNAVLNAIIEDGSLESIDLAPQPVIARIDKDSFPKIIIHEVLALTNLSNGIQYENFSDGPICLTSLPTTKATNVDNPIEDDNLNDMSLITPQPSDTNGESKSDSHHVGIINEVNSEEIRLWQISETGEVVSEYIIEDKPVDEVSVKFNGAQDLVPCGERKDTQNEDSDEKKFNEGPYLVVLKYLLIVIFQQIYHFEV
uniref:Uncharacterized protein LOC114345987 n=1 Tax=Diabrotica virgifera virgifera TaxID=50390 RepID=A0A6P7H9K2_DIAVI